MSLVKCFDVVSMVTDEAGSQFGRLWEVDKEKELALKKCCEIIDTLAEEFGGISYEVEVDDITMDITVSLVCNEIVVEGAEHGLYSSMQCAKRFAVKRATEGEETIQLDYVFPGIWNKAL